MSTRWDETWHRLFEWTNAQGASEHLAAQILLSEGFSSLDPSHPLGGPDGAKDALCEKNGAKWVMAVYFPRGRQTDSSIKKKLKADLLGVAANEAHGLVFVTNQEVTLALRAALKKAAGQVPIDVYHLERVTAILDKPAMAAVRKQFLGIDLGNVWPDPMTHGTLQQLAHRVESEASVRVEILAREGARLLVWVRPILWPKSPTDAKPVLLATACVLSGVPGVSWLEIGIADTAEMLGSVGRPLIGTWRVRLDVESVLNVAKAKFVDETFWRRATVLEAAGDNLRTGQRRTSYDEFERRR